MEDPPHDPPPSPRGSPRYPVDYANKIMLAPMVKIGTLPMRLLSLRYGADYVYGEEIIDFRIIGSTRVENARLGTIDFVKDGKLVFRTCAEERNKVIFQMGTADPERAVLAAKVVEKDVFAVDVNMGCPKPFSVHGGMGAALLKTPDKIKAILTSLVENMSIPVTCKIRILPDLEKTMELVKIIEGTGVAAVGVHGRYQSQRSSEPAHYDIIKQVAQTLTIPVIANGGSLDVKEFSEIEDFRKLTGTSAIMLARAPMWNPSVFRKEGILPLDLVIKDYLKVVMDYGIDSVDNEGICKYGILRMKHLDFTTAVLQRTQISLTLAEICEAWGVGEEYEAALVKYEATNPNHNKRPIATVIDLPEDERGTKKFRKLIEMEVRVDNKSLRAAAAKMTLAEHCKKTKLPLPIYDCEEDPKTRFFRSTVVVDGAHYRSSHWLGSKKHADQAAAVVALFVLDIPFEGPKELFAFKSCPTTTTGQQPGP